MRFYLPAGPASPRISGPDVTKPGQPFSRSGPKAASIRSDYGRRPTSCWLRPSAPISHRLSRFRLVSAHSLNDAFAIPGHDGVTTSTRAIRNASHPPGYGPTRSSCPGLGHWPARRTLLPAAGAAGDRPARRKFATTVRDLTAQQGFRQRRLIQPSTSVRLSAGTPGEF
jgi:hypothetical protein